MERHVNRMAGWIVAVMAPAAGWIGPARAQELCVVAYNVESGGADPAVVAERIVEVQSEGCDIWGFSEVHDRTWAETFERSIEKAAGDGADFDHVEGTTGRSDYLWILYDRRRLQLLSHQELHDMNIGGRVRSPLVAEMQFRDGGPAFLFIVNHLYRGDEQGRWKQAQMLNDWAEKQTLPIIAVGDYNFDWNVERGDTDHDRGYDLFTADGVFRWVRPEALIKSQDSDYNSVLDFVFCAGDANNWPGRSHILSRPGDFPNDRRTSDHRPVWAKFTIPGEAAAPARSTTRHSAETPRERMLAEIELLSKQIAALESQAAGLRKQVEALATLARSMEDRAATTQPGAGRP